MNTGFWLRIGAVWGALAIAMGAFGAHGLKNRLAELGSTANFQTAAQYHMYQALALIALGALAHAGKTGTALTVAGWGLFAGSLIFSGSLYVLSLTGMKWLGAVTPIGGALMIVGWAALAVAAGGGRN